MICPVLLVEIALMICLSKKYTWYFNDVDYQDLKVYEYIEDDSENAAGGEAPVYYLYSGGRQYIDLIQFAMQDKPIAVIQESNGSDAYLSWEKLEDMLPEKGYLIADIGSGYLDELEESYEKCIETASFVLFRAK